MIVVKPRNQGVKNAIFRVPFGIFSTFRLKLKCGRGEILSLQGNSVIIFHVKHVVVKTDRKKMRLGPRLIYTGWSTSENEVFLIVH